VVDQGIFGVFPSSKTQQKKFKPKNIKGWAHGQFRTFYSAPRFSTKFILIEGVSPVKVAKFLYFIF